MEPKAIQPQGLMDKQTCLCNYPLWFCILELTHTGTFVE